MKILVVSHNPLYHSGFAKVTRGIVDFLQSKDDTEITILDILGIKIKDNTFKYNIISEENTYKNRAKDLFIKTLNNIEPNIVLTIGDPWDFYYMPEEIGNTKWIAYIPIEQSPISNIINTNIVPIQNETLDLKEFMNKPDIIVAYNKFGKEAIEQLTKRDDIIYIYHSIDTNIYKPKNIKKTDVFGKAVNDDTFIITAVSRNNERKGIDLLLFGWKIFIEKYKLNTKLYIHIPMEKGGYNIPLIANNLNISNSILTNKNISTMKAISEKQLIDIYNVTDVLVNTSRAEGFGLPIIESIACGSNALVTDYAGPKEISDEINNKYIIRTIPSKLETINAASSGIWRHINPKELAKILKIMYDNKLKNQIDKTIKNNIIKYKFGNINIGEQWYKIIKTLNTNNKPRKIEFKVI